MRAVIWAAGRGSRMLVEDVPKPLIAIGPDVSFLERQVECLRSSNVHDIGVIVGWKRELIQRRLGDSVAWIENTHPNIRESGTTHSLQFAACSSFAPFDGKESVLLLDGDIAYERRVLRAIQSAPAKTSIVVSPRISADSEEVRVYGTSSAPRLIGKGIEPPLSDGLQLLGEFTGVWRVEPAEHLLVRSLLDWLVGRPGGAKPFGFSGIASEHEELAQYLMTLGRLHTTLLDPELLFMEADSPEDLAKLRGEIFPRILENDRNL